jgi:hypothetical protein
MQMAAMGQDQRMAALQNLGATSSQMQQAQYIAPGIDKALIGDAMSTRNNLLRGMPKAEQMAAKTLAAAEATAKNTEEIARNQLVFQ